MKIASALIIAVYFTFNIAKGQEVEKLYNEGMEKAMAGKYDQAIKLYTKAIDTDSNHPDIYLAYYNRAIAKLMINDNTGAIPDLDKAIEKKPEYLKSYLNRGTAKKRLKDYKGAIADYSFILAKDSNQVEALYNRAVGYDAMGKKEEACNDWKKAAGLGLKEAKTAVTNFCGDKKEESAIEKHTITSLTKVAKNDKYGFSAEQPIKVGTGPNGGPENQRAYLNLLKDGEGKPVKYERKGSCCPYPSTNGFMGMAMCDKYELTYKDDKGKTTITTLYLSFYDYQEPMIPVGFK